ncbi:MAG: hypothetical protein QT05_C0017G0004 [archaeon GW2011_AR13]|nr:MAG: hypothetical protein QT05_C0017G0004 [archaeon GW2011_AR13]HIG93994.1 hypothetical protein [Nanoarchaeota archaeon]HIH63814.1 hypothetical protein [Nanoarchaeota archaeon]HIJ09121.1 hypothetical protein [Nanoarchaeota archaeon]
MNKNFLDYFTGGKKFKSEFRRQFRLLVVITLGFTIAFTWRQTVFDLSQSFIKFITHIENISISSILTSIFITLISVFFIYLTSHFLKDGVENY